MKFKYKLINLEHLKCCNNEAIKTYFRYNGIHKFDDNDIKSLQSFIPKINSENRTNFNISYVIERLDKEFDLIKMDEELIINIELKSTYCDLEQCKENYKLLSKEYLTHEIYVFCYESETSSLLKYDNVNEKFIKVEFDEFNKILSRIKNGILIDININISPIYINPEVYLENQYTLSSSQNSAKNEVIKSDKKINIISGRAGSGKSLLALDLYRFYITSGYSVSYLTPFMLNNIVNEKLIDLVKMKTVKNFLGLSKPTQICIVDEAQRLSGNDIEKIQKLVSNKIIFLGDINQNIDYEQGFIKLYENRNENFVLTMKQVIRSDDTFDLFAKKILNKPSTIKNKRIDKSKIEIKMFDMNLLNDDLKEYVLIQPSKSHFKKCTSNCSNCICNRISELCMDVKTTHTVISCEYSKVLLLMCDGYDVNATGIVMTKELCYGYLPSQLYSIITRTTEKLIIITENINVYNYLMEKLENL